MTHAAAQTKINDLLRQHVCDILGWTEEQHRATVIKYGKQYLQALTPGDPAGIDMLVESAFFWRWWQNNWSQRDMQFTMFINRPSGIAADCYKELHDPAALARCIYPNGVVLKESFNMMKRVSKVKKGGL